MLFDSAHTDELKAWLAAELEPVCDADPAVLSDYVLALLRREVPESELAKSMREQLTDFLEDETNPFVDRVFEALSSKSYLPESARQPPPQPPQIPTATSNHPSAPSVQSNPVSSENSRKRKPEDDARDTSPKLSKIQTLEGSMKASPSPRQNHHKTDKQQLGPNVIWGNGEIELRKGQCIDYHLKGFCARGDACQYEHSPNPVLGSTNNNNPKGYVSSMPPAGIRMGAASPTHGPNFGNGLPSTPGRFNPNGGRTASPVGGMNGDSALASRMGNRALPPHPLQNRNNHQRQQLQPQPQPRFPFGPPQQHVPMMMGQGMMQNGQPPQAMLFPQQGGMPPGSFDAGGVWNGGMAGKNARGGPSHRGRGGAAGGSGQFRSQKSDTSLVLENVPEDHLDLVKVNEYFKKFGTITNIQIDAANKKALVSFAKPSQASEAHSSPEVIFGNRFVKCYFQRLEDTSPPSQQQQQQPSQHQRQHQSPQPKIPPGAVAPPPKSSFIPGQTSHVYVAPGASNPSLSSSTPHTASSNIEEKKKLIQERDSKQKELESLLSEQKTLFDKIGTITSAEEKKSVMSRLRSLDKETKDLKEKVQETIDSINNFKETPHSKFLQDELKKKQMREQKEREQLDRELDLHAQGPKDATKEEELKETLRKLQAEATSIGVGLDANGNPLPSNSIRGGRGGFARGGGRGGARNSMKLDNRTTRLLVKGLNKEDSEKRDKAKEHFKQFGEVESFEDEPSEESSEGSPGFTVVYKARQSGEAALRQGGNEIPEIGQVKLSWTNAPLNPSSAPSSAIKNDETSQSETQSNGNGNGNGNSEERNERDQDSRRENA